MSDSHDSVVLYEVDGPTAVITLNRPHAMNAWTGEMDGLLKAALDEAVNDRNVVGIVITGAGRAFCAGADLKALDALSSGDPDEAGDIATGGGSGKPSWADYDGDFGGRFPMLMEVPKPVIAAVNGAVAGMAFPLTLCCDLRFVSTEAVFLTAFAQRGLIAEWGLSWLLTGLVGPGRALDLLFTSRKVRGEEAYALGLAEYLCEPDQLLAEAKGYVERLAEGSSPLSMAVMKSQVYRHLHDGLGAAERESQRLMVESFDHGDFAEGVQSFLQKRPPKFERLPLED